jgi:hypothetical protein
MSDKTGAELDRIPKVVSEVTFAISGVEIKCFVLDDGQRVIDRDSMNRFFLALQSDDPITGFDSKELAKMAVWIKGKEALAALAALDGKEVMRNGL